jgi:ABC-2 type transport system permease protein
VLRDLKRQKALIWAFANRDFATRYRASALGWAWSLVQPLATLVIFAAVFSTVFRVQAPEMGNGKTSYAAFLFTGMVTWNLFSSLINLSMMQLKASGELLKKVHFAAWTPVLGASIVQLIQVALEIIVLIGMFLFLGNIGFTWLLAIPILIGTAFFAQGIGFIFSIMNARSGDVMYIVGVVLGALYFLTPVLYPMSLVESHGGVLAWVVKLNPMSWYVQAMHDSMYTLTAVSFLEVAALLVGGLLVFWGGFAIFNRYSEDIGEML